MHRREGAKREFPDEFDALRRFGSSLLHLQRPRRRFQLCSCSQLHMGVRGPGRAPSSPSLSLTSHFPDLKDTCSDSFLKPCTAESSWVIPSPIEFRSGSLAEAFHAAFANDNVGHPASRKDRFKFWAPPCRGHVVNRAAEEATVLYTIQLIAGFVFFFWLPSLIPPSILVFLLSLACDQKDRHIQVSMPTVSLEMFSSEAALETMLVRFSLSHSLRSLISLCPSVDS